MRIRPCPVQVGLSYALKKPYGFNLEPICRTAPCNPFHTSINRYIKQQRQVRLQARQNDLLDLPQPLELRSLYDALDWEAAG